MEKSPQSKKVSRFIELKNITKPTNIKTVWSTNVRQVDAYNGGGPETFWVNDGFVQISGCGDDSSWFGEAEAEEYENVVNAVGDKPCG